MGDETGVHSKGCASDSIPALNGHDHVRNVTNTPNTQPPLENPIVHHGSLSNHVQGKYFDVKYEYRHVQVTNDIVKKMPKGRLLTETEWRNLGVQQSRGWVHYLIHQPELNVLC